MYIFKSMATISILSFFSKILGFIRDTLLINYFGISNSSDAFFMALKFPNSLRSIFAEGAFSQSFIPILIKYKKRKNKEQAQYFISCIFGLLIIILSLIIFLVLIFSKSLIKILVPGFFHIKEKFDLTVLLLIIIFPYILFISIASFFSSILQTWNNFFIPSLSPIILNFILILSLKFFIIYFYPPIVTLAYAFLIGGLIQIIYQIPYLKKINMLVVPKINIKHPSILKFIKNIIPALLGISILQISLILNNIYSSFLISGSISWIYYADRLIEIPNSILGVTISTVLFSVLSKRFIDNDKKKILNIIDWSLRLCLLLVLPSMIGLITLAEPIIVTLFQYGKFSYFDVLMTKHILMIYAMGLPGFVLTKILVSIFYSKKDFKTPIKASILCLVINQIFNFLFIDIFQHITLVLSCTITSYLNFFLLYYTLIKKKLFHKMNGYLTFFCKILLSILFMFCILLITKKVFFLFYLQSILYKFLFLMLNFILGFFSYFFALFIIKFNFFKFLKKNF